MSISFTPKQLVIGTVLAISFIALNSSKIIAQACNPPINVQLFIDEYNQFAYVEWEAPDEDCPFLYFELEYGYFSFTPGMGQGTLESPLYIPGFSLPDYMIQVVYVRSVCDCFPLKMGDGVADSESAWVLATVVFIPPPIFPDDGVFCEGAPEADVELAIDCASSTTSALQFKAPFAYDAPSVISCSFGFEEYALWRKFIAPSTGAISLNMFPTADYYGWDHESWEDYGLVVRENSCDGAELECVQSFYPTDNVVIGDLSPGGEYLIGFWNNGYSYDYYEDPSFVFYNGTVNELRICVAETVTSISENDLSGYSIFPNPSNGNVQLRMNNPTSNGFQIQLINVSGKLIIQQNQIGNSANLQLSHLPKGVYTLNVITSETSAVKRIVLQ